jgi:DNA-binding GntR family transcriptional regulator
MASNKRHTLPMERSMDQLGEIDLAPIDLSASLSLRELAYVRLKEAILEGRIEAGLRVNERTLAKTLGVSTTPIKDALRRLEQDGLVVTLPRRGTYVSTIDPEVTHEQVLLRAALEGTAARLAAERIEPGEATAFQNLLDQMEMLTKGAKGMLLVDINEAFHREIHRLSRSQRIARMLNSLQVHNRATRNRILQQPDEMTRALDEHRRIAHTIMAKNGDAAELAMRQHVLRSADYYKVMSTKLPTKP